MYTKENIIGIMIKAQIDTYELILPTKKGADFALKSHNQDGKFTEHQNNLYTLEFFLRTVERKEWTVINPEHVSSYQIY